MTKKNSGELRQELGAIKNKIRFLYTQREQAQARMRETVAGNLEWLDLSDIVKEIDAQLPGLTSERRTLERELARALTTEVQAETPVLEDAKKQLRLSVEKILSRLREECDQAATEIIELAKTYYPEGKRLPEIAITPNLGSVKYEHHPEDNAVFLIVAPLAQNLASKREEAAQIVSNLNAEMGGR